MSGGNGWLGMSLSAPVFADAVHRVRSGSVTLAFDGASTCTSRRPSTRPIDRRWDKSRGIVFSNHTARAIAQDHTWTRAHGIIFDKIPASTRSYASNPRLVRKPPPATKPTIDAVSAQYAVENVHRGLTMGMNQRDGNLLRGEITALKKDIQDREKKIVELEKHGSGQQEKIEHMTADYKRREKQLQETRTAEKSKLEAELRTQKQLVVNLDPSKENLEKTRAIAREEGRRGMEIEMRQEYERKIQSLKESHGHQLATIEEHSQVLKDAKIENNRLIAQHERQQREHQAAIQSAKAEVDEHKRKSSYLQLQYIGRQRRSKENRLTYAAYRDVFDNVAEAAYDTMPKLMSLKDQLQDEARVWRRSAATFQNAKHLHLFRQQSRYNIIRNSINEFLEGRSAHAELGSENILQLATKLRTDIQTFKGPAHNSRMLTRLLHFDDEQTAYGLTDATYNIAMVFPFRERRDKCVSRIVQIEAEVSDLQRSGQNPNPTLQHELVKLRERRSTLIRLLNVFEIMRRLKAYQALLQDDPVEKAVFARTIKAFEDVTEVQDKFLKLFDEIQASSGETGISGKDLSNLRQAYRDDETKARRALDELQDRARSRCVLEQELGQLTSTEQIEADREINKHIVRLEQQHNDLLDQLVPSMRFMGRQSRSYVGMPPKQARPSSVEDMQTRTVPSVSAVKSARPAPMSDLELALKTPTRHRTTGQTLMVWNQKLKTKQRVFMQQISSEALQDREDDQAQDMLGVSRRIARLEPRVHADGLGQSLKMWEDLLRPYKLRRKAIASLPNLDTGAVGAFDETITAIALKISHLKLEMKAAQVADGGFYPGMNHDANDVKSTDPTSTAESAAKAECVQPPTNNAGGVESALRADSVNLATDNAKVEHDSDRGEHSAAPHKAIGVNDFHRPRRNASGRKHPLRRERTGVRKHVFGRASMEHVSGSQSTASLVQKLEANTRDVSDGTSASASNGGLNLKPTGSLHSQHSPLTTTLCDVRGFHQSTTFSREPSTAATSNVDSLSHLQEAELHALDEAFSTMPIPSTRPPTLRESLFSADNGSVHHSRDLTTVSTMAVSASAKASTSEDNASEYFPSYTSSTDSAADALDPSAVESNDVDVKLAYNIPTQDYRAAVMASPNSSAAFWSHRLYKGADGKQPAVFYCKNFEAAERQARLFTGEKVLGFDLEWEPQTSTKTGNIKRNVSLIQIAAEDKIALFQIALFKGETVEELMPPTLKTILECADVVKAGVNVVGDARRVRELLKIDMEGVFELSHLYRVVKYSEQDRKNVSFRLVSLAAQVQDILMLPLKKDDNRISAWSRELNTQQTDYAASDAYAGLRLYHKLNDMRKSMSPAPPMPGFLEQELPLTLGDGTKVYKSTFKPSGRKTAVTNKAVSAEEEEDEYFDAVEDQDTDDLAANLKSLDIACDDGAVTYTVTYPTMPKIDTEATVEIAKASDATEVVGNDAPSKRVESSRQPTRPDTAELEAADAWVAGWRFSLPPDWTVSARPSELRAYHLWHHQGFALKEVAALCREPPLALTTVASYVMQALKEENLPYDPERVRGPREILPTSVHRRYQKIFDRIPK